MAVRSTTLLGLGYLAVLVILGFFSHADSQRVVEPMSKGYEECLQFMVYETPTSNETGPDFLDVMNIETQAACLQDILWKNEHVKLNDFNITDSSRKLIASLATSLVSNHHRAKRFAGPLKQKIFPQTGWRIRREYRRLLPWERRAYHDAVNALKANGEYDDLANIHSGAIFPRAHLGPAFFGWHRVYLALYEEALRRINRWVSLPYWDSSLDYYMDNPANSIIWSEEFMGNGLGLVTSGPFADWNTPFGSLTRFTAGSSVLISKVVIADILSRCRTEEISRPTAEPQYNLELAHDGVHVWTGGHMANIPTAPHDPIFFMHHAFIDYLWELFRIRQASPACNRNPETDYPPGVPSQGPNDAMPGFPQYNNLDGYRAYWTRFWYRYERSPTCSPLWPFCGTPLLRCDVPNRRCVSVARRVIGPGAGPGGAAGYARGLPSPALVSRARAQANAVRFGLQFRGPPTDGRTADVGFRALM